MVTNRNTIQRDLVRHAVIELPHPTAEEVYLSIFKKHPSVSKATVYRNLGLLVEMGEINRFSTGGSFVRYDYNTSEHCHTYCTSCGKIEDLFCENTKGLLKIAEEKVKDTGFSTKKSELVFYGQCAGCIQK